MSDIRLINDSEQTALLSTALNGEIYMKAAGSTDEGALVVFDSGSWRTFANEAVSFPNQYSVDFDGTNDYISTGLDVGGASASPSPLGLNTMM